MATRARLLAFPLLVVSFAPSSTSSPAGSTRYVSNTDPVCGGHAPCYTTIQAAVTAALPGETVLIRPGSYTEQVSIQGKNNTATATEAARIFIQADPNAPVGSVVLRGAIATCTSGHAIRFQQSKFVTVRGVTITGAGGPAISLMGGNNQNQAIVLERLRIFGNGSAECNGGITIARGNPGTLVVNSLIYANGRNGIATLDADGGPHSLVNNTIYDNGWNGISVTRNHDAFLVNNAITGNGLAPGTTGGRFGVTREASTTQHPAGLLLLHNLICGNRLGEFDGQELDVTDSGNLTPTGTEGLGVIASPGCGDPATTYAHLGGVDGRMRSGDDDVTPSRGSPLVDHGIDLRIRGVDPRISAVFEADFFGSAARPRAGTPTGPVKFDIGAVEVQDTQAPLTTFLQPPPGAYLRQTVTVQAQATDAGSGISSVALMADAQALAANPAPPPPGASITATASWVTTSVGDGAHTLTATAIDRSGNRSVVTRLVIVDNTPPVCEIAAGPSGTTSATTATFAVTGTDNLTAPGRVLFAWRLDGAPFNAFSAMTTATLSGLTSGAHTFEVKARDQAGNESAVASRSFTVSNVQVTITSPTNGAMVRAGPLLVQGTVESAGAEVGVAVNGISAALQGSAFAALVPVAPDTATLTASATTVAGVTEMQSIVISVSSTAAPASDLLVTPQAGLAPLTVSFSLPASASASVAADFNGDGVIDFTGAMLDRQSFTYIQPGVYFPRVTFTDGRGNPVTAQTIVQVYDRVTLDVFFKAKWSGMKTALMNSDIEGALTYFNQAQQGRYRTVFNALTAGIAPIARDMQDIEQVYVIESVAKYRIRRVQFYGPQLLTLTYYIYFIQDASGLWSIESF